jgi:hypothetical protein
MIIKPKSKVRYVLVPNELIGDPRLSLDTWAMIISLLSKPPNWKLWCNPLAKELATLWQKRLGRKKLDRMLGEARAAGYMARSAKQIQHPDGSWGHFDYIVGMPKDVLAAVRRAGEGKYLWECRHVYATKAHAANETTEKSKTDKLKTENNYPPHRPLLVADAIGQAELTAREAESNDVKPAVVATVAKAANDITNSHSKEAEALIKYLEHLHGCTYEEAREMFFSLPDVESPD